jgi:enoyl-CoA hydratase
MNYAEVKVEKRDGISILTLNRPDKLNAVNQRMREEILEILDEHENDKDSKVLIFTGVGKAFSSGQDIDELKRNQNDLEGQRQANECGFLLPQRIYKFQKTTIGAINGVAAGDGAQWVLAFDLNVASEDARFGWVATALGLV